MPQKVRGLLLPATFRKGKYFFDFNAFAGEYLKDEHDLDHELFVQYDKLFSLNEPLEKQPFFIEYVSLFKTVPYKVPDEQKNAFDWKLLMQFAAASIAAEVFLKKNKDDLPDLSIRTLNGSEVITKSISQMFGVQIYTLFGFFCKEQINMYLDKTVRFNELDAEALKILKKRKLKRWNQKISRLITLMQDAETNLER